MELAVAYRQGEWAVLLIKDAVTLATFEDQKDAEEYASSLEQAITRRMRSEHVATPSTQNISRNAAEVAKRLQEIEP